jgi:hypothetical protein
VYDLRYSEMPLTEDDWFTADGFSTLPAPKPAGSKELVWVTGLSPGTTFYFALKKADEAFNWSGTLNAVVATTRDAPITVPFAIGNRWDYTMTETSEGDSATFSRVDEITGTVDFEGSTYWVLQSTVD